jgi:hypothetical protein
MAVVEKKSNSESERKIIEIGIKEESEVNRTPKKITIYLKDGKTEEIGINKIGEFIANHGDLLEGRKREMRKTEV